MESGEVESVGCWPAASFDANPDRSDGADAGSIAGPIAAPIPEIAATSPAGVVAAAGFGAGDSDALEVGVTVSEPGVPTEGTFVQAFNNDELTGWVVSAGALLGATTIAFSTEVGRSIEAVEPEIVVGVGAGAVRLGSVTTVALELGFGFVFEPGVTSSLRSAIGTGVKTIDPCTIEVEVDADAVAVDGTDSGTEAVAGVETEPGSSVGAGAAVGTPFSGRILVVVRGCSISGMLDRTPFGS